MISNSFTGLAGNEITKCGDWKEHYCALLSVLLYHQLLHEHSSKHRVPVISAQGGRDSSTKPPAFFHL